MVIKAIIESILLSLSTYLALLLLVLEEHEANKIQTAKAKEILVIILILKCFQLFVRKMLGIQNKLLQSSKKNVYQ